MNKRRGTRSMFAVLVYERFDGGPGMLRPITRSVEDAKALVDAELERKASTPTRPWERTLGKHSDEYWMLEAGGLIYEIVPVEVRL